MKDNPFHQSISDGFLHNSKYKMRAAAFMSCSGSNFEKILEYQLQLGKKAPFEIAAVVADTKKGYENSKRIISITILKIYSE